ncbi:protein YdgV [Citrobacter freundii]
MNGEQVSLPSLLRTSSTFLLAGEQHWRNAL